MQINICIQLPHAKSSHLSVTNMRYHNCTCNTITHSLTHSLSLDPILGSCGAPLGPTPNFNLQEPPPIYGANHVQISSS